MNKIIVPALIAIVLAGCSSQVNDAKTVVKEQLTDPESAQFENVVTQKTVMVGNAIQPVDVPATCGWVNGANRLGGMAGAERFVVKAGVSTFGDASDREWSEAFMMCVVHSNDTAANDRLSREGARAIEAYGDAVEALTKDE